MNLPKNLIPGFVAAKLGVVLDEQAKKQLRELGFRVWRKNSMGVWKCKAAFEKTSITIQSQQLALLLTIAKQVWVGLHE